MSARARAAWVCLHGLAGRSAQSVGNLQPVLPRLVCLPSILHLSLTRTESGPSPHRAHDGARRIPHIRRCCVDSARLGAGEGLDAWALSVLNALAMASRLESQAYTLLNVPIILCIGFESNDNRNHRFILVCRSVTGMARCARAPYVDDCTAPSKAGLDADSPRRLQRNTSNTPTPDNS